VLKNAFQKINVKVLMETHLTATVISVIKAKSLMDKLVSLFVAITNFGMGHNVSVKVKPLESNQIASHVKLIQPQINNKLNASVIKDSFLIHGNHYVSASHVQSIHNQKSIKMMLNVSVNQASTKLGMYVGLYPNVQLIQCLIFSR